MNPNRKTDCKDFKQVKHFCGIYPPSTQHLQRKKEIFWPEWFPVLLRVLVFAGANSSYILQTKQHRSLAEKLLKVLVVGFVYIQVSISCPAGQIKRQEQG